MLPGRSQPGQSRPGSGTQFDGPGPPVWAVPSQLPLLTRAPSNGNELSFIGPADTKKAAHSWTATTSIADFGTNDKTEHLCQSLLRSRAWRTQFSPSPLRGGVGEGVSYGSTSGRASRSTRPAHGERRAGPAAQLPPRSLKTTPRAPRPSAGPPGRPPPPPTPGAAADGSARGGAARRSAWASQH